jgi:cyclopropane-fatty-acyl-phospholipid synthase
VERINEVALEMAVEQPRAGLLERKIEKIAEQAGSACFEIEFPGEAAHRIGRGVPAFRIVVRDSEGMAALRSFDETRIGEAYLDGRIDVQGDLVAALRLRAGLLDRHPGIKWWSTYGRKWVYGQTASDRKWIAEHYDTDPEFYLLFLDRQARCYSHAYFENENESLESATQRKLDTAFEACGLQPGSRVLDIGAGWGAFSAYAGRLGAHVTSLTISEQSEKYVGDLIRRESLPCRVLREHFLEHQTAQPYDAIVNLGVTEHLPDYAASLKQYQKLLKPGGRVYLDACASETKYPFSTFIQKYIWPGNATPVVMREYLDEVRKTDLEVLYIRNDRRNYMLTCKHWAESLDRHRDLIIARWGERHYRRFRLYLWGCVHEFLTNGTTAYRWVMEYRPQLPHQISWL